ncbi:MAG TPA: aconitate hydratase B, partial [Gammaproteobacteria bacterium]|nr:aconitate hydratase B [Gammaproteobacteria bacterium]
MLTEYRKHEEERRSLGIPPLALNAEQVSDLVELIKKPPAGEEELILDLFTNRIPAGVDQAAYVKAAFLSDVAKGNIKTELINNKLATELLGTMLGGYNVEPLINLLKNEEVGDIAVKALSKTLLIFDSFHDVFELSKKNDSAKKVISSWAEAEWFLNRPEVPESITARVLKVDGEINTDDLSPGPEAWSRPDIPLHALTILKNTDFNDPIGTIEKLEESGDPVAFVGDIMGTGSSRKSATNSLLWHIGDDIPHLPNKRDGGICLGGKIAPIFFNTLEDSGTLAIECDVT